MAGNANSGRRDLTATPSPLMDQVRREPASRWGPAMLALDVPKRTFVIARVVLRYTLARAAEAAGSVAQPDGLKVVGKNMAMRPDVAAAIVEEVNRMAGADSVTFYANLKRIANDTTVKAADRVRANALLLERGAPTAQLIKVEHEHQHNVTLTASEEETIRAIEEAFSRPLSDEAKRRLTHQPADVVDAEFTPVAPEEEWVV